MSKLFTKVGAIMCAAHRDRSSGRLHGHTWEVWASFPYDRSSAIDRQAELRALIARHDHDELPEDLAWAEDFAEYLGSTLPDCVAVSINRPAEMLSATWEVA